MNVHVGQKLVCIRDSWRPSCAALGIELPIVGQIYTIRTIIPDDPRSPGLWLQEIVNPPMQWSDGFLESSFALYRDSDGLPNFRPVVDRKTDISIFTRLLNPKHQFNPNELVD